MRTRLLVLFIIAVCAAHASDATTSKKRTSSNKKPVSHGRKTTSSSRRSKQQSPTSARYREIQQALVDKGYLKGEPTGVWDSQSADALRQFQTDQKLSPTGKINAPSIIALGLGPKNGEAAAPTTSKAAAQPVSPADGATGVVSNHDSAASPAVSQ